MKQTPNPGSDEAGDLGCKCAVLDNNHGKYAPWPPDGWWITESCPVHAMEESDASEDTGADSARDSGRVPAA